VFSITVPIYHYYTQTCCKISPFCWNIITIDYVLSQTALGWLKVCYDVDDQECQKWPNTFLFLPYVAIGWRLVTSGWWKAGVRFIRGFLLSLGLMSVTLFLEFSPRSRVYLVRPASGEDCSLDSPWSYSDARYVRS
jgi:hypothetical protein